MWIQVLINAALKKSRGGIIMCIPREEYPRPNMVRAEWLNLNGEWEFEIDNGNSGKERKYFERERLNSKIIVPFAPESELSGLKYIDFMKSVWYKRTFNIPQNWSDGKVLIHFGAVDYLSEVWINGISAGIHKGGYTPFEFDITSLLKAGENTVVVNDYDDVLSPLQPSGKQCNAYYNMGCLYTRSTGIWQTVWLEYVPDLYIKSVKLTPDVDNCCLYIDAVLSKYAGGQIFSAKAVLDGSEAGNCEVKATGNNVKAVLKLKNLRLWNPGTPVLYYLELKIGDDCVTSYFGMRKIEINGRAVEINGKPVFQRLVLDQGYYPDGIYTAPKDEDLKRDIELSMDAGFNGARMHMKIFEPRYIYWADKLGYMIWGEYPNWGLDDSDERAMLVMLPEWIDELKRDYNSPAIIGWCPFNETSLKRNARFFETVYNVTKAIDSTRPVIDTSGYTHAVTDIYDVHDYDQNVESFKQRYESFLDDDSNVFINFPPYEKYEGQPYFISEFGGTWWSNDKEAKGWGYGDSPKDMEEFYTRYEGLVNALLDNSKICAFCYTQITDVMQEQNGIYTFDRKPKFDVNRIKKINSRIAAIEK
jgi:beta-galactosidase/beta-glucuronidase